MTGPSLHRRLGVLTFLLFLAIVLWDASGLDLPLARAFGTAQGFAWRDQPTVVLLLHELPRAMSGVLLLALIAGVFKPWGFLRRMAAPQRRQLVISILAAMAVVSLFKRASFTSCPWDLAEFGGVARYVSHWALGLRDEGPGHCFPAGHASAAFAYVAGWFALRRGAPGIARVWLPMALGLGLLLGVAQQARGAHYMSHTLWTAWICWAVGLAVDDTKLNEA
jgi:membrane-associated PAP2 superfamily phosphatase